MKGKIVLITGSTSGIGKQTAVELAGLGATVLLHARTAEEGLPVISQLQKNMPSASFDLFVADFEKQQQVQKMVVEIETAYTKLDVLINNAALYSSERKLTEDSIEKTFAVNHLAPFLLAHLLMPLLKNAAAPRIINVSSQAHFQGHFDICNLQGEKTYDGVDMYCSSKLCNLLFTYQLASKLENQSIMVNAVHPGLVATDLYLGLFTEFDNEPVHDAAETIVYMACSPEVEIVTGEYFLSGIPILSSYNSYIKKYQRQLWELSERLTSIDSDLYMGNGKETQKRRNRLSHLLRNIFEAATKSTKRKGYVEYNLH